MRNRPKKARHREMDFENSTQVKCWIFTPEELHTLRQKASQDAVKYLKELKEQRKVEKEQAEKSGNEDATGKPVDVTLPKPIAKCFAKKRMDGSFLEDINNVSEETEVIITPEEEQALMNFYCSNLPQLVGPKAKIPRLRRDIKIASTASVLMRRFFLSNSILLFNPIAIMIASAFIASKIEDLTVDVRYLEDGSRGLGTHTKWKEIVESEIDLTKGIDFDLCCFHPYKAVLAYTQDLRGFLKSTVGKQCVKIFSTNNTPDEVASGMDIDQVGSKAVENQRATTISGEDLRPIHDLAFKIVEQMMFGSDIMLLAPPGKIGLVAMILANEQLLQDENVESDMTNKNKKIEIDFSMYLRLRFGEERKENEIDQVWNNLLALKELAQQALQQATKIELAKEGKDLATFKAIHKKLKKHKVWGKEDKDKKKKKKKRKSENAEESEADAKKQKVEAS